MRVIFGAIAAIVLVAVGGLGLLLSGRYDVAADRPHLALTLRLIEVGLRQSVRAHAHTVPVPPPPDPSMVEAGARRFHQNCEGCHGAPGVEPMALAKGLYPRPPGLAKVVPEWSAQEQYWIIWHGLKFTGMPAWGEAMVEGEVWEVVSFLDKLPTLPAQRYRDMVQPPAQAPTAETPAVPPAEGGPPSEAVIPPSEGTGPEIALPPTVGPEQQRQGN
jgi:mono/diheme cytochrome c family protein